MAHSTLLILGMILVTLHGFSVDISGSDCSCDTFTTQLDCNSGSSCEWTNSECVNVDCSTKTTILQCNVANSVCAFTPASQCAAFTSCSDYKYSDETTCLTIGCLADTKGSDGLYPCKAITSIKKCSEITVETECTTHQCFWNSSAACVAPTCAQQTTATDCIAIRSDVVTTWQICSWTAATSTCADATGLTQSNCAVLTRGSYYWNTDSSACEVCQGSSSYAQLISLVLALLMLSL